MSSESDFADDFSDDDLGGGAGRKSSGGREDDDDFEFGESYNDSPAAARAHPAGLMLFCSLCSASAAARKADDVGGAPRSSARPKSSMPCLASASLISALQLLFMELGVARRAGARTSALRLLDARSRPLFDAS